MKESSKKKKKERKRQEIFPLSVWYFYPSTIIPLFSSPTASVATFLL
jgi:hypothetical protein